jgi:hypothetical protein
MCNTSSLQLTGGLQVAAFTGSGHCAAELGTANMEQRPGRPTPAPDSTSSWFVLVLVSVSLVVTTGIADEWIGGLATVVRAVPPPDFSASSVRSSPHTHLGHASGNGAESDAGAAGAFGPAFKPGPGSEATAPAALPAKPETPEEPGARQQDEASRGTGASPSDAGNAGAQGAPVVPEALQPDAGTAGAQDAAPPEQAADTAAGEALLAEPQGSVGEPEAKNGTLNQRSYDDQVNNPNFR